MSQEVIVTCDWCMNRIVSDFDENGERERITFDGHQASVYLDGIPSWLDFHRWCFDSFLVNTGHKGENDA